MRIAIPLLCSLALGACAQQIDLPLERPLADAGNDQLRLLAPGGLWIGLDGRGSCDPEGAPIDRFFWELRSAPAGSTALLEDTDRVHAGFVAERPGRYQIELRVTAAGVTSEPDAVLIELSEQLDADQPPSAPERDRCGNLIGG